MSRNWSSDLTTCQCLNVCLFFFVVTEICRWLISLICPFIRWRVGASSSTSMANKGRGNETLISYTIGDSRTWLSYIFHIPSRFYFGFCPLHALVMFCFMWIVIWLSVSHLTFSLLNRNGVHLKEEFRAVIVSRLLGRRFWMVLNDSFGWYSWSASRFLKNLVSVGKRWPAEWVASRVSVDGLRAETW